ncbi:serine acetyltransferase [Methylococcus geothermalis]|uniref:Serine acetyltransferase n=1 Tax=Methylococcus geothermalis TaxID=2681310 RepID=A0A858Q6Z1_9GAMM|nr:serine acetyltransferase [Methylococcus geothermalis]QJD29587.1 serine acetyltransferase [Methylococcus geothermalis]
MKWDELRADTYRQYGSFNWGNVIKGMLFRRTFRPVVTLRLCQAVAAGRGPLRFMLLPLKVLHRLATHLAAMDFSWKTRVGGGLALTHGWGLVVNQGAVIGRNVTLFHGVTLGRRDRIAPDGTRLTEYPVIEDEVWIGPHAIIVGGVTVGRGSRIAGGAFVTESVPPYSVVAGNPASIVKNNCTPDVMNPAPLELLLR